MLTSQAKKKTKSISRRLKYIEKFKKCAKFFCLFKKRKEINDEGGGIFAGYLLPLKTKQNKCGAKLLKDRETLPTR